MARHSQDREDLLRDATALVNRAQLQVKLMDRSHDIFFGFRAQGAASIYFDQDPVYHFNDAGELRRAFVDDLLIKSERGQLVTWRRQTGTQEVAMIRAEMTAEAQREFCQRVTTQLQALLRAIVVPDYVLVGQVTATEGGQVVDLLAEFLERTIDIKVAASPRVSG